MHGSFLGRRLQVIEPSSTIALYERLVGPAWQKLALAVQRAHLGRDRLRATGVFSVRHGRSRLARWLAWLMRMPAQAEATTVVLEIARSEQGETWTRSFGKIRLITLQREARGNLLGEKFGPMELLFQLTPRDGALGYLQRAAALCLGRWRLPIPSFLAPQVAATEEEAASPERSRVTVTVTLPLLGMLIRYQGELEVERETE